MRNWETLDADVVKLLTRHFTKGRGGNEIDKVVVHYNAGNLSIAGCWSVWQNAEASAHYQVEESGRIGQLVWDGDTAWHCGVFAQNQRSIGIEHANRADGTISEECLDNGAHLVAAICKYYGLGRPEWLKNVFPHKHFVATSCPGQIYGSQKAEYIRRAQEYYDEMTGSNEAKLLQCIENGYWGTGVTRVWQAINGIDESGMLYRQPKSREKYLKSFTSSNFTNHCIKFVEDSEVGEGSLAIRRLQNRKLGIPWSRCTGVLDAETVELFIKRYCHGYEQTETLNAPSTAVRNFAKEINAEAREKGILR